MLYTRKGDKGTTKTFGCDQRISKSSSTAEALGSLDEINSFLGITKILATKFVPASGFVSKFDLAKVFADTQQNLFIVQAELAGAKMSISQEKVLETENIVDTIEKEMPPIKTFFVSGGTELAATTDFARTLSRRAERRVVGVHEEGLVIVGEHTLAYMNRLSSLLYALARYANFLSGLEEVKPEYK